MLSVHVPEGAEEMKCHYPRNVQVRHREVADPDPRRRHLEGLAHRAVEAGELKLGTSPKTELQRIIQKDLDQLKEDG